MKINVDLESVLETAEHFQEKSEKVKGAIGVIIKKSLFVLERHAKYYSPVDTGRMRASIGASGYILDGKFATGEQSVEIGETFGTIQPTVTYAKYVHRRVPFMSAAAQDSVPEIQEIANQEINKAVN